MKRILFALCSMMMLFTASCSTVQLDRSTVGLSEVKSTEEKPETREEAVPTPAQKPLGEPITGSFDPTGFAVGFGRYVITPSRGTPMAGYGNTDLRLSERTLDDIYITCVAVKDEDGGTALIFSVDVIKIPKSVFDQVSARIEAELGIPADCVFMTATHTHSAGVMSADSVQGSLVIGRAVRAARDAIATLDRAEMYIGSINTEKMAYVRRYVKADGSYIYRGDLPKNASEPEYRHETDADNEMQIIRFVRENQKDVLLVNWTCHVTTVGGMKDTRISADWVGAFRSEMEKDGELYFSFMQGAAGNVTPGTRLVGEKEQDNADDHVKHGKDLSVFCKSALPTLTKIETGKVRGISSEITCRYVCKDDVAGYNLEHAAEIKAAFAAQKSALVTQLCKQYGYASYYHASKVLSASKRENGSTAQIRQSVVAIGDVVLAGTPFEIFDVNGMQVKNASKFKMTFMCGYTNGAYGYLPNIEAFPNYQYEVDTTNFVPGTAEQSVAELLRLMENL